MDEILEKLKELSKEHVRISCSHVQCYNCCLNNKDEKLDICSMLSMIFEQHFKDKGLMVEIEEDYDA